MMPSRLLLWRTLAASLAFLFGATCGFIRPEIPTPEHGGSPERASVHPPPPAPFATGARPGESGDGPGATSAPDPVEGPPPSPTRGPSVGEAVESEFEPPAEDLQQILSDLRGCDLSRPTHALDYLRGRLTDLIRCHPSAAPLVVEMWDSADEPTLLETLSRALDTGLDEADDDWEWEDPRRPALDEVRNRVREFFSIAARTSVDPEKRATALGLAGADWDPAEAAAAAARLVRSLATLDPDAEVRIRALDRLRPQSDPSDESLVWAAATQDADPSARRAAIGMLLYRHRERNATGNSQRVLGLAREALLKDRDESVRKQVVWTWLQWRGREESLKMLPSFEEALAAPGMPSLRRTLLDAVVRLKGRDSLDLVRKYRDDPEIGPDARDYVQIFEEGRIHSATIYAEVTRLQEEREGRRAR